MSGWVSFSMLPARDGDCIVARATDTSGNATTILVDGGRKDTYPLWKETLIGLLEGRRVVDLVVVTHIDADHIGGILAMLDDEDRGFEIAAIWFNGYPQVEAAQPPGVRHEAFSPAQADSLSRRIGDLNLPWNGPFGGGPIHRAAGNACVEVGPFKITVLGPTLGKLAAMAGPWAKAVAQAADRDHVVGVPGLEPLGVADIDVATLAEGREVVDTAKPNGSSICLMLEALGRRLLLSGDCHPDDLAAALAIWQGHSETPVQVDVFKVSHHGAYGNTTRSLLGGIAASVYAFSTDGSHRDHPDDRVVAKVILSGGRPKTLVFNYSTSSTGRWRERRLTSGFGYTTKYSRDGDAGHVRVDLEHVMPKSCMLS